MYASWMTRQEGGNRELECEVGETKEAFFN